MHHFTDNIPIAPPAQAGFQLARDGAAHPLYAPGKIAFSAVAQAIHRIATVLYMWFACPENALAFDGFSENLSAEVECPMTCNSDPASHDNLSDGRADPSEKAKA